MNRLQKAALVGHLIQKLHENRSWCGETHVQKATFLLQEMMGVPLEFDFILYKHGPFSFDLRDEVTSMRADRLVELKSQLPYGPRIVPTDRNIYIKGLYSKTLSMYENRIAFVAEKLGDRGVAELERLATAFYISKCVGIEPSVDKRAKELMRLKPHITPDNAMTAIEEIEKIKNEAKEYIN
jgi:uncharacterized protein YwgA